MAKAALLAQDSEAIASERSYDPAYFAHLFQIEDQHFWFRARNLLIGKVMAGLERKLPAGYRVLEVGCGTGNVLRVLERVCSRGTVVGMDLFGEGLAFARHRVRCALVQGDAHSAPFSVPFDIVGLFDVVEHLPDDEGILRDLSTLLKPGGRLILTVPAHMSLWSYFDEASHHCRRYGQRELEEKLMRAGLHVEYVTQYMVALFPLVWLGRRFARLLGDRKSSPSEQIDNLAMRELRIVPVANILLYNLLRWEARAIIRRRQLPIGTSLLAVARRDP